MASGMTVTWMTFVNSHRYINCNDAVCRNCHEMNIHIVKGLLHDCASLVKKFFTADTFTFEDCMEKPLNFDPFGHARFAHLFVLYD